VGGPSATFQSSANHFPKLRRDHVNNLYPSVSNTIASKELNEDDNKEIAIAHDNGDYPSCHDFLQGDTTAMDAKEIPQHQSLTTTTSNNPSDMPFPYSTDQKWTVALLKILDEMNAPDYAFSDILDWARSATSANYSFYPRGGLSRSRNLDNLFRSLSNSTQLLPTVVSVPSTTTLLQRAPCDVIAFDFVPQLRNLLQNRSIMIPENLVIDLDNPLCRYEPSDKRLGEAISGSVYREAYDHFISQPTRQLFVPIIQWID
jgi:hypothetical protein